MREVVGCGGGGGKSKNISDFFHSKYFLLSISSGRNSTLSLKHSLGLLGRRHSTVKTENICFELAVEPLSIMARKTQEQNHC